jgi:hypothetical protein
MFMRAVLSEEERVGMLLFDEPSAALNPTAEHGTSGFMTITSLGIDDWNRLDLFTRIRELEGEKTMTFTSRRFGQLTRPANIILYVTFRLTNLDSS